MRRLLASAVMIMATLVAAGCSDNNDNLTSGPPGLTAPTGLTVQQQSLTSAQVSWTAVTGATGYLVQRADASNPGTFTDLGGGVVAAPPFVDTGVAAAVAYTYRVAAVSASDTSDFSATASFTSGLKTATLGAPTAGNNNTTAITADRTLFADTVYTLSGYVKVASGATLTIEPGTKIVGDATVPGSSLWILRGAKLMAEGTAAAPIVFTSAKDPGSRKPGDWGGIIIIGNGVINRQGIAEILTEGGAAGVAENYAGGTDDNDNSGVLRYVRIEFAGFDLSNGAGQELNSLSSYAVGRGTTYEFLQTMSGLDDSFEFWGGAVDLRYLVSYEAGDDHFDWTEGYHGRGQFLIAFQSQRLIPAPGTGVFSTDPRLFEGDGCDPAVPGCILTTTSASTPYSMPVWANFTAIGPGQLASIPADGNGAVFRRGTGGTLNNGIIARAKGIAVNLRDEWTDSLFEQRDSLNINNLVLAQNGFNFDTVGAGFAQETKFTTSNIQAFAGTVAVDTLLGISLNPAALDWTPKAGSPAAAGGSTVVPANLAARVAGYFGSSWVNTTYIGAADPTGAKWWQGWTAYNIN